MAIPNRTPLGASTVNRMWFLDVDTAGSVDAPNWVPVMGVTDFQPKRDTTLQEDSDFDSGGFASQTKTAEAWSLELKVARKTLVADQTSYDAGQEFLRGKALGKMGSANSAHVRWYEMTDEGPRAEAYEGFAAVAWSPDGGKMSDLSTVSITLTGQGAATEIAHPDTGVEVPVVELLDPAAGDAAGGDLVQISGFAFTGASEVNFGDAAATSFDVVDDGTIEAVSPAGAAGAVDVTVTTPAGTSVTGADTQFTYA